MKTAHKAQIHEISNKIAELTDQLQAIRENYSKAQSHEIATLQLAIDFLDEAGESLAEIYG